jgi:hypothetical protein
MFPLSHLLIAEGDGSAGEGVNPEQSRPRSASDGSGSEAGLVGGEAVSMAPAEGEAPENPEGLEATATGDSAATTASKSLRSNLRKKEAGAGAGFSISAKIFGMSGGTTEKRTSKVTLVA